MQAKHEAPCVVECDEHNTIKAPIRLKKIPYNFEELHSIKFHDMVAICNYIYLYLCKANQNDYHYVDTCGLFANDTSEYLSRAVFL